MDGHSTEPTDPRPEWGPFGRPLFQDPSARALSRVGVVDVGSNSVRLVVFDGAARSPAYFFNEKILCGLGRGLAESGVLNPEGRGRAVSAMQRFQMLAEDMGVSPMTTVATAAVREATDGPDFCREIEDLTGVRLWVIDGEEEARLSAQGVLLGWPDANGLVCDIGGASMELAAVRKGEVGKRVTSPLGPLKLQNLPGGKKGLRAHIQTILTDLADRMGTDYKRIYLVGGSWRAFARCDMDRRSYPLHVQHEYRMSPQDVRKTVKWIAAHDLEELQARTGTSSARMSLVPIASEVLKQLVRIMKPKEIAISSYGIREGMLYEQMPDRIRKRDPLIEACRFEEAKEAREPGFGKVLYDFLRPIFRNHSDDRRRIIKAACMLHDVTWRAHPDFRAEVCFDNATRANLGALTHPERVWLGLALMHRYKNSREGSRFEPIFELLTPSQIADAEIIGKAMRFGAMLGREATAGLAEIRYKPRKKVLYLRLSGRARKLYGEVAEARFKTLAQALNSEPVVDFVD